MSENTQEAAMAEKTNRKSWFVDSKLNALFGKSKGSTKHKASVKKSQEIYFTDEVIYGIVRGIVEKEVSQFIFNKALEELETREFYSGYIFKAGTLKYFALKSEFYLNNKVSIFTLPLLSPGRYAYSFKKTGDKRIFIIDTEDDKFSVILTSLDTPEAKDPDLKSVALPPKLKIPSTLKLRWSYQKTASFAFGLSALVLLASVCFVVNAFMNLNTIQDRIVFVPPKVQIEAEPKGKQILNILNTLQTVASSLQNGAGIIDKVTVNEGKMIFLVRFANESDAQLFLKNVGGKFESGRVIYETSI